jgi:hypothetical protein
MACFLELLDLNSSELTHSRQDIRSVVKTFKEV